MVKRPPGKDVCVVDKVTDVKPPNSKGTLRSSSLASSTFDKMTDAGVAVSDGTLSDDESTAVGSQVDGKFSSTIDTYMQEIFKQGISLANDEHFEHVRPRFDNVDHCVKYFDGRTDEEIDVVLAGVVCEEGTLVGPYGNKVNNRTNLFKVSDLKSMKYSIGLACPEHCSRDLKWQFAFSVCRLNELVNVTLSELGLNHDANTHSFVRTNRETLDHYIPISTPMFRDVKNIGTAAVPSLHDLRAKRRAEDATNSHSDPLSFLHSSTSLGTSRAGPSMVAKDGKAVRSSNPLLRDMRDPFSRYSKIPKTVLDNQMLDKPNIYDRENNRIHPFDLEHTIVAGTPVAARLNLRFYNIPANPKEGKTGTKAFTCVINYVRILPPTGEVNAFEFLMTAASALSDAKRRGKKRLIGSPSEESKAAKKAIIRSIAKPVSASDLVQNSSAGKFLLQSGQSSTDEVGPTNIGNTETRDRHVSVSLEHSTSSRTTRSTTGKGKRKTPAVYTTQSREAAALDGLQVVMALSDDLALQVHNDAEADNRAVSKGYRVFSIEFDRIFSLSDFRAVYNTRGVSRDFINAIQLHFSLRFNRLLSHWLREPAAFRSLMRHTGTFVSGSAALRFLFADDEGWWPGDLDVYVRSGAACQDVITYLTSHEEYTLDVHGRGRYAHAYPFRGFIAVHHLSRVKGGESLCIDVVESFTDNPLDPIFKFHSTLVMNWLSCDSISIRFAGTLHRQGEVTPYGVTWHIGVSMRWRTKYLERGFIVTNMGGTSRALGFLYTHLFGFYDGSEFLIWSRFLDGIDVYEGANVLSVTFLPEI
ncbi:hypothetical protein FRB99_005643 [Tulasnella sp. 403]|nr:hypothetical protein FRB99_005643 [Tulasnella sp. 403]